MSEITLIMCQGQSSRWTGNMPKHLARIAGEAVVARTVRQLSQRKVENVVIIGEHANFDRYGLVYEQPDPQPEIARGIRDTQDLWLKHNRATFLCGDVVFSEACLDAIYCDTEPIRVFGRSGQSKVTDKMYSERFALTVEQPMMSYLLEGIVATIGNPDCLPALKGLYYSLLGAPCEPNAEIVYIDDVLLYEIDDYTDDLDKVEEWALNRRKIEAAIEKELVYG